MPLTEPQSSDCKKCYNGVMRNFTIEKTDSQCIVTWYFYSLVVVVLFILLAGLTVGSVFFTHVMFVQQQFQAIPFVLAFWGFWFLIFVATDHYLFGKTMFVLNEEGLNTKYTCLMFKSEKRFALAGIRFFVTEIRRHTSRRGNVSYSYLLQVVQATHEDDNAMKSFRLHTSKNKSFSLPPNVGENEVNDLCNQLNVCLKALKTGQPITDESVEAVEHFKPEAIVFGFDSPPQHLEPPKSRWHYQTDYNGIGFQKRGEDTMPDAIMFFIGAMVLFGIAAMFFPSIDKNAGGGWLGAILSISGFVLVGLVTAFKALNKCLESRRVTTWMFDRSTAEFRIVRFGSARSKTYDLYGWKSLVVQITEAEYEKHHTVELELKLDCDSDKLSAYYNDTAIWQLAFHDSAGETLMSIEKLRKPEALWMADVVLCEQRAIR
jgi:hypothetical protein